MVDFYEKEYVVRKAAQYGHETTLNPLWVKNAKVEGKPVKHLFDGIYVLVPPGVKVDKQKLKEAVIVEEAQSGLSKTIREGRKMSEKP